MKCPYCDQVHDYQTDADLNETNEKMEDGDFSFCGGCGQLSEIFNGEMVKITDKRMDEIIKETPQLADIFIDARLKLKNYNESKKI